MFFHLSTFTLFIGLIAIIGACTALGLAAGRAIRDRPGANHQPVGVVQGALLALIGLLLAFGLTMAVGRYEARRALVVQEANDLGTAHLRAQLLAEPARSRSLGLLEQYADAVIVLAHQVPDTGRFDQAVATVEALQRSLWAAAGDAVAADGTGTGPRLYVETLNDLLDTHTERVASLSNRVPAPVMLLEVVGSALALGMLSLYLALLGRGMTTSLVASAVVVLILFVSFDLDRPERGFIKVPSTPLEQARAAMLAPPAFGGP